MRRGRGKTKFSLPFSHFLQIEIRTMKIKKKNALAWIAVILLLAPFIAYSAGPYTQQYDSFTVSSGSMEPEIPKNSLIYTAPTEPVNIRVNDTITFTENGKDSYTTHRVIEVIETEDKGLKFRTKGDANEDPDPGSVNPEDVVGKVFLTIPFLGGLIYFAKTSAGAFTLVVLPAVGLVLFELYNLFEELR